MADARITSSDSGSSSRLTHVAIEYPPSRIASREKITPAQSVELEAQPVDTPESLKEPHPWVIRARRVLHLDHPRVLRAWVYFRGPRPKVDLPSMHHGPLVHRRDP